MQIVWLLFWKLNLGTSIHKDLLERVRTETNSICLEKFILELNPMKTKSVKETFKHVHHQKYSKGGCGENTETKECCEKVHVQSSQHSLLPEYSSKFGMGKRQSPETKVGCSVGNHTKDKLDGLNCLVNDDLSKAMLFLIIVIIVGGVVVCGHLLAHEVGLGTEQHRDRNSSNGQEQVLHASLSLVHRIIHISRSKGNVDQGCDEVGRLAAITRPTKVKGAFVSEGIIALADVSPGGTGAVATTIAVNPHPRLAIHSLLVINTAPGIPSRVKAG